MPRARRLASEPSRFLAASGFASCAWRGLARQMGPRADARPMAARPQAATPEGAARAPFSRSAQGSDDSHDDTADLHVVGDDRLESGIRWLKPHSPVFPVEALQGCLLVGEDRYDGFAIAGALSPFDQDQV